SATGNAATTPAWPPTAARHAPCGAGITVRDHEGRESELDYENVGLLGPNLEIFDIRPDGLAQLSLRRLRHRHDVGRLRSELLRRRHRPRRASPGGYQVRGR
ncbi:MAG: hypothetical protein MZV70_53080, partial [Desulfobacterales bacterium]|nr:hypothetical protein [Desulfobacterales bacterium]